jgi:phytoene/squalene synthetase
MAAPVAARRVLFPLYAFNLEVARAPWVTQEPIIARMRLQWWRDALAEIAVGGLVRRHEVVTPLALAIRAEDVPVLDRLIEARDRDVEGDAFADEAALWTYLEATTGGLISVAARRLGGGDALAAAAGRALGVANWLMAVPALEAAGRQPLPDGQPETVARLAGEGLAALGQVRAGWSQVPVAARAAFYPLAGVGGVLRRAAARPALVAEDGLEPGQFGARLRLALTAGTGRLW